MHSIFLKIEELKNAGIPSALCTVIDTQGSTPRKAGAKMIVFADGKVQDTIGGGSIEKEVIDQAIRLITEGKPGRFSFNLKDDLGMHCGGKMEVFIEPIVRLQHLFIFGAGHIGKALASFARELEFSVSVIDPRPEMFDNESFAGCSCIVREFIDAAENLSFSHADYIVIVTPKHISDEDVLAKVALKPHRYVGMIGSGRKVALLKKRFLEENILTAEVLDSIDMPIGLKMNAETPQEIAVSILAKLIDVRNA